MIGKCFPREAAAVGLKAVEQDIARKKMNKAELIEGATKIVKRARDETRALMKEGIIAAAD